MGALLASVAEVLERDATLAERLRTALATDAAAPAVLLDRAGLARALSTSTATIDRLRAEPGFPELRLIDAPRFVLADVLLWIRARSDGPGLRLVGGP